MTHEKRAYDLVVAGGGMAGMCAALAAATRGLRTALVQDRPVLGGNGSKEIRVWLHGADGGENNRYFREGGLVGRLLLENLWRNPTGQAELWDTLLLETVLAETNLDLYLNTAVTGCVVDGARSIQSVEALTLGAERRWTFSGTLFADCTGDGTLGALAGASCRRGCEASREFAESLAPGEELPASLGGSILFALKDLGKPVPYVPPAWAHRFDEEDLRFRRHPVPGLGHEYWWIEYGGELDTISDNEAIKFELLRVVHGLVDHLKNHPNHAEAMRHYTLEWVGSLPGKRESRRLAGEVVLTQHDLVAQTEWPDVVAMGGWTIDHHPPGGFFSPEPPCYQFHLPGVYGIPLRALISRDIPNLFFAGRNISATHIALCSTRVMLTCAQMGEAIGAAAAHAHLRDCLPRDLLRDGVYALQQDLLRCELPLPGVRGEDPADLARAATATESSSAEVALELPDGECALDVPLALMLPLAGKLENISLVLRAEVAGELPYRLCGPDPRGNFMPGPVLLEGTVPLVPGGADWVDFPAPLDDAEPGYYWLILPEARPAVTVATTRQTLTGVLGYRAEPGWEAPELPWKLDRPRQNAFSPWRRWGVLPCFRTDTWIPAFYGGDQVINGFQRPWGAPNLWISTASADETGRFPRPEWLELSWEQPVEMGVVCLYFNTDLDRDLRNLWVEASSRVIPECVRDFRLCAWVHDDWQTLAEVRDNRQRWCRVRFPAVVSTRLRLEVLATHGDPRAQVFELRVYPPEG